MENRKGDEARFRASAHDVEEVGYSEHSRNDLMCVYNISGLSPEWVAAALNAHDKREKAQAAERERLANG